MDGSPKRTMADRPERPRLHLYKNILSQSYFGISLILHVIILSSSNLILNRYLESHTRILIDRVKSGRMWNF